MGTFAPATLSTVVYRTGHYGMGLLTYAPLGVAALLADAPTLAFLGGAVALWLSTLPDVDHRLPLVEHRGATHTVAFALLVGTVTGGLGALAARSALATAWTGAFGFAVGATAILGHLLADALTPAGIRPFRPVSDRRYSLSIATASNPIANYALLAVGAFVTAVALVAAGRFGV